MNEEVNGGCLPKLRTSWRTCWGGQRIHPSDPVAPKDSEFVIIESKFHLRVIHLLPDKVRQSLLIEGAQSKRGSTADDYWFMRTNRGTGRCHCSFRNSIRRSYRNSQRKSVAEDSTKSKVEQYAEELIETTLTEALNECIKLNNGVDNVAYDNHSDQVDSVVTKFTNLPSLLCAHNRLKPLIMFVHGLGSTADIWNILMHNLSFNGFEVVAPDLLGHGFSSAPTKASHYQFKSLVNHILGVFDHFMTRDEKRKCILIGHSYGCSLITALYPHRASKISQLVLISGGGPTPLAPPANMNTISPYGWAHNCCYPLMYCGLKRSFFYSSRGKNFKFCEDESSVPPQLKDFLINGQYWPEGDASFHRRILVPTLLVHGLQDKNVTLVQECEMERTVPRSFLELIPDAGHMSMVESAKHLTHMISCFIEMWT